MKIIIRLLVCLLPMCASGYAANEVLRIKLEWVNAKECGLEGCKPQNIIMREGSFMMFGWPELKERGFFEVRPSLQGESVTLKLKRMVMKEGNSMEMIAEADRQLFLGKPQDVAVGDVRLRITITEEQPEAKK
jgi:hypothetical protein